MECNVLIDDFPSVNVTMKTIGQGLCFRRTTRRDILSYRSTNGRATYKVVVLHVEEAIRQEFKDASIIHLKCSSLRQPQVHLSIVDYWEDTGNHPTESPDDQAALLLESQYGFRKDR